MEGEKRKEKEGRKLARSISCACHCSKLHCCCPLILFINNFGSESLSLFIFFFFVFNFSQREFDKTKKTAKIKGKTKRTNKALKRESKMKQSISEAVSSSTTGLTEQSQSSSSSSSATLEKSQSISAAAAAEDLAVGSRDGGGAQETVTVDRRGDFSAVCRWTVQNFPRIKARALWSKYFEVGGYDCRLLIYPKGDSQALPGYISIYLQIVDPRGTSSSKWDCFASYRLAIVNVLDDSKTVHRDSWHRFSSKKKSHGWCDFTPSSTVFDSKLGYLFNNESILITADILILNESVNFTRDNNEPASSMMMASSVVACPVPEVLSGKFTWKVHNFSLFKEMIKTQKIMSPVFPAGECNLRISVYQSSVNGTEYLSMCLESKDTEKTVILPDRSCWCLFRMSVLNQKPALNHMHRDSYGRFAADNKSGDNTSLGWNDYMKMSDFVGQDSGFLVDDTAVFSTSFHVIKEFSSFSKNGGFIGGRNGSGIRKSDGHLGKFTWRIENFTRLKDLLKKRKITGLCIKSRRFQVGNRDCRLIVYPRGMPELLTKNLCYKHETKIIFIREIFKEDEISYRLQESKKKKLKHLELYAIYIVSVNYI